MKVLLINPPDHEGYSYIREGRCMQKKGSWASMWMPLTVAYIASVIRDRCDVKLVDCQAQGYDLSDLARIIEEYEPRLFICNTGFPTIKSDYKAIELAKRLRPECTTSIFGMYPSLLREKVFEECRHLDIAVVGEPEWSYSKLVDCLKDESRMEDVPGLIFKTSNGDITLNQPQHFNDNDLDSLPFPARDLLNNEKYLYPLNRKPFTLLMLSRGCPYSCTFCNAFQYYGKKFRRRSVDSIISEIRECVEVHQISNFLFWGESFSLDFDYAHEITDAILESDLKINWSTRTMVDRIDIDLLKKMKRAGCKSLSLGIESFNQSILENVKKGTHTQDIENAIRSVKEAGIISVGHFVIGLPGDSEENVIKTIKFAKDSGLDYAQFYCAVPYPNTPLGETARMRSWIESEDYSKYHLANAVMRNEDLTVADIKKLRNKAYRQFYARPKLVINTLKRLSSPKALLAPIEFKSWAKT